MPISHTKLQPGCWCAEAMGFKIWKNEKTGSTLCCAEIVLQDYADIPTEISVWYDIFKKDGSFNQYAKEDIQKLGLAIGYRPIANITDLELNSGNEIKHKLFGRKAYLWIYKKGYTNKTSGFSGEFTKVEFLPIGAYPTLVDRFGEDEIDMGVTTPLEAETIVSQVISQERPKKVTLEPLPFEAGGADCPF